VAQNKINSSLIKINQVETNYVTVQTRTSNLNYFD